MQQAIRITSEQEAYAFLARYLEKEFVGVGVEVKFEGWPRVTLHLEGPQFHSSLTPSVMKGFVALQKEIYRSYCIAKFNSPSLRLSRQERRELEIQVKVSQGTSCCELDLQALFEKFIELSVGKMDGTELAVVMVAFGAMFFGTSAFRVYLEHRRTVRESEVKSEEQRRLVESLQFASGEETKRAQIMADLAAQIPRVQNLKTYSDEASLAMLRCAMAADVTEVQGVEIDCDAAEVLAQNARVRSREVRLDGIYRIQFVDSSAAKEFRLKVFNIESREQFVARVQDSALTSEARTLLKDAEWSKSPIALKINAKEARDTIRDAVIIGVSAA